MRMCGAWRPNGGRSMRRRWKKCALCPPASRRGGRRTCRKSSPAGSIRTFPHAAPGARKAASWRPGPRTCCAGKTLTRRIWTPCRARGRVSSKRRRRSGRLCDTTAAWHSGGWRRRWSGRHVRPGPKHSMCRATTRRLRRRRRSQGRRSCRRTCRSVLPRGSNIMPGANRSASKPGTGPRGWTR